MALEVQDQDHLARVEDSVGLRLSSSLLSRVAGSTIKSRSMSLWPRFETRMMTSTSAAACPAGTFICFIFTVSLANYGTHNVDDVAFSWSRYGRSRNHVHFAPGPCSWRNGFHTPASLSWPRGDTSESCLARFPHRCIYIERGSLSIHRLLQRIK